MTWVALNTPELFEGYVIVSPSLWYDGGMIFAEKAAEADPHGDLLARIYLGVGSRETNREHDMVADLQRLVTMLEGRKYTSLRLSSEIAVGETHNSVFPRAFSNGLRFVLGGR